MAKKKAAAPAVVPPSVPDAFCEMTNDDWVRVITVKHRGIDIDDSHEHVYTTALSILRAIYYIESAGDTEKIDPDSAAETIRELANELAAVLSRDF